VAIVEINKKAVRQAQSSTKKSGEDKGENCGAGNGLTLDGHHQLQVQYFYIDDIPLQVDCRVDQRRQVSLVSQKNIYFELPSPSRSFPNQIVGCSIPASAGVAQERQFEGMTGRHCHGDATKHSEFQGQGRISHGRVSPRRFFVCTLNTIERVSQVVRQHPTVSQPTKGEIKSILDISFTRFQALSPSPFWLQTLVFASALCGIIHFHLSLNPKCLISNAHRQKRRLKQVSYSPSARCLAISRAKVPSLATLTRHYPVGVPYSKTKISPKR
jgi:hypothetical protein